MRVFFFVFVFVGAGCCGAAARAATVDRVPVGNGVGVATVRVADGRLDDFFTAPYAFLDEGQPTPQLLFDAYVGVRVAGVSRWLTADGGRAGVDRIEVVDDADAYRFVQHEGPLDITTTVVGPFGLDHPAVIVLVEAHNTSNATVSASFPTLANFHVGGGSDNTDDETAAYLADKDAIREVGPQSVDARQVVAFALKSDDGAGSSRHLMTPQNPFPIVENNLPFPDDVDSAAADDVVTGFVFDRAIAAGAVARFGVLYAAPSSQAFFRDVADYVGDRTAKQIVDAELAASRAFVASATLPASLSPDERKLAGVQLALLRAAQVRDRVDGGPRRRPNGGIVASLPPGIWQIVWARDLMVATRGLFDAGKVDEAGAALDFVLDGDVGEYVEFVGSDYGVSMCRYYGGGREESDSNAGGPNIEWDDLGLFLQLFSRGMREGLPLDARVDQVKSTVANVLLSLIDEDGLLVPDSSIWETHVTATFESQGAQKFTYSSAMAAAGLDAFADALLDADAADVDAARYRAGAATLRDAVAAHLVDDASVLAACREELDAAGPDGGAYLDAAVVEAFNHGVVVDPAVRAATLDALTGLAAATGGYYRNDAGGEYDSREWMVIDLWMAQALRADGRLDESNALIDLVTQRGLDELGLIPELINEEGRADGAFPMLGFGAGAYLTALTLRAADLDGEGEGEGEGEGDVVGEGEGEEGEGEEGEGEGEEGEGEEGEGEGEEGEEGEGELIVCDLGDASCDDDTDGCGGCNGAGFDVAASSGALLLLLRRRRRPARR